MDTTRFILVLALAFVSMMLWQEWQNDYGVAPQPAADSRDTAVTDSKETDTSGVTGDVPTFGDDQEQAMPEEPEKKAASTGEYINVETDTFRLRISLRGGSIVHAALPDYPIDLDKPDEPFVLLNNSNEHFHIIQGGLLSKTVAPTHEDFYSSGRRQYSLQPGEDVLEVPLTWSDQGITVTKTFHFRRGSHLVDVSYRVENRSGGEWQGRSYQQLKRSDPGRESYLLYTYTGAVISSPEDRYKKIDFDDIQDQKLQKDIVNGWAAMLQHYFVTAIVPADKTASYRYYTNTTAGRYFSIGGISPALTVPAGDTAEFQQKVYAGPKVQDKLAQIADGLELTVDYGILWFISKPLFWCLKQLHDITGNWGWAIILVTVFLKILFYRLSAAGYRSMANMRRVQPRIMSIRDRYKNDKQRLNQAMMDIYKEEKINPLGGCFPILIQIPVFIALYWVLLESIELRHAPFILWIRDLSAPDPFWVLPVLMGITMFIQQKLNPAPMDPVQEKVMMSLPFVFTIFFGFFPSGLVLYWVVNNVLSIAQQWMITRKLEKDGLSAHPKK
ncbi:MAG: membrane protein insertase YidC [Gammaproteobacteria bacterium]